MNLLDNIKFLFTVAPAQIFGLNLLDIIIFFVVLFYAYEGYSVGFIAGLFDLLSFIGSFLSALTFYSFFGKLIAHLFSIPTGFSNAFGFFIAAFLSEIILGILLRKFYKIIILRQNSFPRPLLRFNALLGIIPAVLSALILFAFLFTVIVSLPFSPYVKKLVTDSLSGSFLVSQAGVLEERVNAVFGGAASETLNFLTVEPQSNESVKLNFSVTNPAVDSLAEEKMLVLVNNERTSRGIKPLVMNDKLTFLARDHSRDMFKRSYFSHITPDGLSPFDRMQNARIDYTSAGENLALAPNVDLAMQGLMNSPGHRANILSTSFGKVGIGVMDGGIYGEMFSQEFTD